MAVIAIVGVLAFLIGWLVRMPQGQRAPAGGATPSGHPPRWYEFTLALLLLAAIAAFLIWLISSGQQWVWGETFFDWRSDPRAIAFAAIMIGLVVAIVLLCWIALPRAEQYALLAQFIYPASAGLALVLVFDKATRTWGTKRGAET